MRSIDARFGGMGDYLVALWIAEGARRVGDRVAVVGGRSRDEATRLFGLAPADAPRGETLRASGDGPSYADEMRTAAFDPDTPRAVRWQRTLGWNYEPARPVLGALPPEAEAWAESLDDGRPLVVIAPRSHYDSRCVPVAKWHRVARALEARGVRTVAVDARRETVEAFPFFAHGYGWAHNLALLRRAAVVAGADSGLAHLSATVGRPTVVAMGPTRPAIVFGHALDVVRPVAASAPACAGCHFQVSAGYEESCALGCEALQSLPWEALRDAILENL